MVRFRAIDGMRGLAALLVVIGHVYEGSGSPNPGVFLPWVLFGNGGVDLFFALSGFCLYYPLTRVGRTADWGDFFRRRARRLLPPYYAALAAVILLPLAVQPLIAGLGLAAPPVAPADWHQVWTHALFAQTLFYDTYYDLNGPLWSLAIEWQFYLAFPLAVWLISRLGWRAVALIGALTLAYRIGITASALNVQQWRVDVVDLFPSRWIEFVLGMLVAVRVRRAAGTPSAGREILDLLGLGCLFVLASYLLYGPLAAYPYPMKDLLNSVLWSFVLFYACKPGAVTARVFANPVLVWLGIRSYTIYLIHLPLIFALGQLVGADHLGQPATFLVLGGLGLPLTLACAALSFEIFERPFLNSPRAEQEAVAPALRGARGAQAPLVAERQRW